MSDALPATAASADARFMSKRPKLLYVVNEAFFFVSHRLAVARRAVAAGFEVHVAAPGDHVWAPEDFSVEVIRDLGFEFHEIPLSRRGTKPGQELATLWALFKLYRALKPDLVHHLTIKPVLYGGAVARLLGLPAVSTVTGLGQVFIAEGLLARLLRGLVKRAYRFAAGHRRCRVIVQNPDDGKVLVGSGAVPARNLTLVRGSGVSLAEFPVTPDPGGVPLIVLPARLIWDKGVAEFVAAARALRDRGLAARFALVGDTKPSNPRAVPQRDLEAWHDEGVVEWWGRRTDMPAVLQSCHIVCLPSSYGEGVPKVLLEAAASGRPIVASDIAGCREVVHEGENGFLVSIGDHPGLVQALRLLIEDSDLRQRLGARSRAIVEDGLSEDEVVRQTLALYDDALGRPMSSR